MLLAATGSRGPGSPMEWLGIKWVGITAENGHKLLLTLVFVAVVVVIALLIRTIVRATVGRSDNDNTRFWTQQAVALITTAVLLIGLASIWFDNPDRLSTVVGLASAGLAFALQRVITSFAGYF